MTQAPAVDVTQLRTAIEQRIQESNAEFGVCVRHVQSGTEVLVNPDALYPMASVFKIPILIETLFQVDEGKLDLDARIEITNEDRLPPSGVMTELQPGLQPTLHDLLMLMIIVSDNMATDLVLRQIGLERVNERMRALGLDNISVTMSVEGLFNAALGPPEAALPMVQVWRNLAAQGPIVDPRTGQAVEALGELMAAGVRYDSLPGQRSLENNVSSPRDMGALLERLIGGELLSPQSTDVALNIMLRQQLNARIPRYMPQGVGIAHKTGTFLTSRNDAGIVYLPDRTHLVVVTFAILQRDLLEADPRESTPYIDRVDGTMGLITRDAYDMFSGSLA